MNQRRPAALGPPPTTLTALAVAVAAALLWACASGPETGVRDDFADRDLQTVAVVPFYTSGSFGLDDDQHHKLRDDYQRAAVEALEQRGVDVVRPDDFQANLDRLEMWEDFRQGISLTRPLTDYFTDDATDALEVRTLLDLASRGAFSTDTLLFGEIVYHTTGTCHRQVDDYIPYARVTLPASAPAELPRPCVTSHFQAKLVDVKTGRTMWFNRMFVETHAAEIDDRLVAETISSAVDDALTDDDGLTPLAPPRPDAIRAESD